MVATRAGHRRALGEQVCQVVFDFMMALLTRGSNDTIRTTAVRTIRLLLLSTKAVRLPSNARSCAYSTLSQLTTQTQNLVLGLVPPLIRPLTFAKDIALCEAYHAASGHKLGAGHGNRRPVVPTHFLFEFECQETARQCAALIGSLFDEVDLMSGAKVSFNGCAPDSDCFVVQCAALNQLARSNVRMRVVVRNRIYGGVFPPTWYASPNTGGATWGELDGIFAWVQLLDFCPEAKRLVESVCTELSSLRFTLRSVYWGGIRFREATADVEGGADRLMWRRPTYVVKNRDFRNLSVMILNGDTYSALYD